MEFAWHVHHDTLVEPLTEPLPERQAFIRQHKPTNEIDLRLRLLQLVQGQLPAAVKRAGATYKQAAATYWRAGVAVWQAAATYKQAAATYWRAGVAYKQAVDTHKVEIEALHAQECPNCPWDGESIFPKAQGQ